MQPANLGRKQTMMSLVWKKPNGGFLKWGYPKMDGLNGKIVLNGWLGGTPILGNPQMLFKYSFECVDILMWALVVIPSVDNGDAWMGHNGTLHNPRIHHGMHGTWHLSVAPLALRWRGRPSHYSGHYQDEDKARAAICNGVATRWRISSKTNGK